MAQLPFGFDPEGGPFANVKLPPPRVNNRYTPPAPSTSPYGSTSPSSSWLQTPPRRQRLSWWQRFDRFISNIGNWFAANFEEAVVKVTLVLYFLMLAGAAITVIAIWVTDGFWSALIAAVVALIGIGICYYVGAIVLPLVTGAIMFAGRFIFWNAVTFTLLLVGLAGWWGYSAWQPSFGDDTDTVAVVESPTYTCTARVLNIRSQPNTSSRVLGVLRRGEQVKVLDTTGDFAHISYNGETGYVSTKYLEPVAEPVPQ